MYVADLAMAAVAQKYLPGIFRIVERPGLSPRLFLGLEDMGVDNLAVSLGLAGIRLEIPLNGNEAPLEALAQWNPAGQGYFTADDLQVLAGLRTVWNEIADAGWIPAPQLERVRACLDAGLLAFPVTSQELQDTYGAGYPAALLEPALTDTANRPRWIAICERCGKIRSAYIARLAAQAAAEARDAAADAAFWGNVRSVAETVRDTAAMAGTAVAGFMFGRMVWLALGGAAGIGLLIWSQLKKRSSND